MTVLQPSQTSHGKEQAIAVACKRAKRGGTVQKKRFMWRTQACVMASCKERSGVGNTATGGRYVHKALCALVAQQRYPHAQVRQLLAAHYPKPYKKMYCGAIETVLYFPNIPYSRSILHSAWSSPLRLYALFLTQTRKKMTSLRCVSHQ